jgi:hypothetical protein
MDCTEVREDRMDVLYGEAGPEAERRVLAHHAACAACRDEFDELRGVRRSLSMWRLPEEARPRSQRRRVHPLAGLAAAAGLLLALAGAVRLSGASFEYRAGNATLRVGGPNLDGRLAEQESRHAREIQALRAALQAQARRDAPPEAALLARVEQLIRENEQRQELRFNTSLEDLAARAEAQRRYDLARVSAGLSYLDGKTGQHVARTSELMGYVLQASEKK